VSVNAVPLFTFHRYGVVTTENVAIFQRTSAGIGAKPSVADLASATFIIIGTTWNAGSGYGVASLTKGTRQRVPTTTTSQVFVTLFTLRTIRV